MENNLSNNSIQNYLQKISNPPLSKSIRKPFPMFNESLTLVQFWNLFLVHFETLNNKKFEVDENSRIFVFTILSYFLRNQKFFASPMLHKVNHCNNSFEKGLIIVGGFGVGKTTLVKTIVSLIELHSINFKVYPVRYRNTLQIVEDYENSESISRNYTTDQYSKGFRVFDDVKNEREASNFGKVDLFKEILYKRYESNNFRTILICNYDSDFPNDMEQAIESFSRYGDRNFDRFFETFNFIEYKGSSKRK